MIRRWVQRFALPVLVGTWAVAIGVAAAGTVSLANDVDTEQVQLEAEVARLEAELRLMRRYDKQLRGWIAKELRPWVIELEETVAETADEVGPSNVPEALPLPSVPPVPTPTPIPSPIPTDTPSPSIPPTPEPTPTPCLPVICSPSPGVMPGSISMGILTALIIWFAPSGS